MSSDITSLILVGSAVLYALGAVVTVLYLYGALWSSRIREALTSPLFKDRAKWIEIIAIFFAILVSSNLLIRFLAATNFYLGFLEFCIINAAGIVTFAWVDTTVRFARRSDPLNRNTLKWKQLRLFIWFFTFVEAAGSLASVAIFQINFFNSSSSGGAFITGSFGWVFFGFIALALGYRRTKDVTLKEHLKWFGLFLLVLFIVDTILSAQLLEFRIAQEILLGVDAYFLYRCVKSLAPYSRAPLEREIANPDSSL